MNAQQHAKLTRARVLAALFTNPADNAHIIGLPEALTVFLDRLGLVESLALRQVQSLEAIYLRRDAGFEDMTEATLWVAGLVYAHADRAGLAELAVQVAVKPRVVTRGRFEERVKMCQGVHDAVAAALGTIPETVMTVATLAELQQKIDTARDLLAAPRSIVVDRSVATDELEEAFRKLDAAITGQLDRVILPLWKKNPALYNKHRANSLVIDRPGTRSADQPGEPTPVKTPVSATATVSTVAAAA